MGILTLLLTLLTIPHVAGASDPQVFETSAGTLEVSYTETASDHSCTGSIDWARSGVDCSDSGFRAFSAGTLNRCCTSSCWSSVQGTMVITAYVDASTGEPLAPGSGGVPVASFPSGTKLVATAYTKPEAVALVGAYTEGTAYAELTIGPVTVSATSSLGDPGNTTHVAEIDTVDVMDGSAVPIFAYGSHTEATGKIGYARILCLSGSGTFSFALHTPAPLELPVPAERSSWGRIKKEY